MKRNGKAEAVAAVVYRIHTLLHTIRAIERHEEQLCGIMTEIRMTGVVTAKLDEELRDLLEGMPAHEYTGDIDAVREALSPDILSASDAGRTLPKKNVAKKAKKPSTPRSRK